MREQTTTPSKKITVDLILSWIFGVIFALIGIVSVFSEPIPGLVMLIMAAVLLPPINKLVDQKWDFHLSGGIKIAIVIIGFIIFGTTIDTSDVSNLQTHEEEQIANNENVADETITNNQTNKEQPQAGTNEQQNITTETIPTTDKEKTEYSKNESTPAPTETVSQKNAVRSAKDYLNYSAFSHDGLVEQLEYEQFSHADAVYGADNSGADWNKQAARMAKSYMEYSAFSRGSLIEQLIYEKFTQAQAEYGANSVGL